MFCTSPHSAQALQSAQWYDCNGKLVRKLLIVIVKYYEQLDFNFQEEAQTMETGELEEIQPDGQSTNPDNLTPPADVPKSNSADANDEDASRVPDSLQEDVPSQSLQQQQNQISVSKPTTLNPHAPPFDLMTSLREKALQSTKTEPKLAVPVSLFFLPDNLDNLLQVCRPEFLRYHVNCGFDWKTEPLKSLRYQYFVWMKACSLVPKACLNIAGLWRYRNYCMVLICAMSLTSFNTHLECPWSARNIPDKWSDYLSMHQFSHIYITANCYQIYS